MNLKEITKNAHQRHYEALERPGNQYEHFFKKSLRSLELYIIAYKEQYPESNLADDSYSGECWLEMARGIRGLLNCERGRLDGGLLDTAILELAKEAGFTNELD